MGIPLFPLAPDLNVSRLCFGTMTFGEQNSLPQSFRLLDEAFDAGINFIDTAEMYPVPQRSATQGRSEEYIGRWMRGRKIQRDRVVLATKVTGPSGQMTWIRDGPKCLDAKNIIEAIDASLLRLGTDYIDLYHIHWPDRYVPMFGETEYDPSRQYESIPIEEQLDMLGRAVIAGKKLTYLIDMLELFLHLSKCQYVSKRETLAILECRGLKIRYVGLSNETPYGVMKFLQLSKDVSHYPKIVSIQNSYSLLCRNFDFGLAECCHHGRVSLLAYSPMAMGILSGKYFSPGGGLPDCRMNLFRGKYSEGENRYNLSSITVKAATEGYLNIAEKYAIRPACLAIAFVLRHPLVASAVFGATKVWQLRQVIEACKVRLTSDIIREIDEIHMMYPNPCP